MEGSSRFPGQQATGAVLVDGLWGEADPNDCLLLGIDTGEKLESRKEPKFVARKTAPRPEGGKEVRNGK